MAFCVKCGRQLTETDQFCPSCGNPVARTAAPGVGPTASPQSAHVSGIDALTKDSAVQGYWFERLIAFAIDAVVISVAFGILAGILVIPSLISSVISGNALDFGVIFGTGLYSFLNSVILVAYFALAESLYGTTLGKSVMGLKVVSVDGRPLTLGQTFIRDVSKINWVLLLLDVIFGLATQQDYKQKYSDKYARTMVVKRSYVFA